MIMSLLDIIEPYKDRKEEIADEFTYDIEIDDSDIQSVNRSKR